MQYKTTGIILKRSNLGEADRIITICTNDRGKIRVVAKGVRKTLSKLAGHLELFCLSSLQLAEGRNLDVLTGAQIKQCFTKLRQNLTKMRCAYYICEIIDKLTEENEDHPEMFSLLKEVLENINSGNEKLTLAYFEIQFLVETGFRPELYNCVSCKEKIVSNNNYLSYESGGLVCEKCAKDDIKISDQAIKILRLLIKEKLVNIINIKIDKKNITEVEKLTRGYLNHTAKQDFKSQKYLGAGQ